MIGKKLVPAVLIIVLIMIIAGGCGRHGVVDTGNMVKYDVYFLNSEETKVTPVETAVQRGEVTNELTGLIEVMQRKPEDLSLHAPFDYSFGVNGVSLNGEQVIVNFDEQYLELKSTTAVLGILTADMFIDNGGTEINAYETATLTLYFTNETGDMLVSEKREVEYNSNIALERIVVDQILAGPEKRGVYPTINPETGVVSVSIKDGICYVNLDQNFLTQVYNVTSEVTIYSITNSLIELGGVNQVQIMVEGESNLMYREKISLDTLFERNLELIEK